MHEGVRLRCMDCGADIFDHARRPGHGFVHHANAAESGMRTIVGKALRDKFKKLFFSTEQLPDDAALCLHGQAQEALVKHDGAEPRFLRKIQHGFQAGICKGFAAVFGLARKNDLRKPAVAVFLIPLPRDKVFKKYVFAVDGNDPVRRRRKRADRKEFFG